MLYGCVYFLNRSLLAESIVYTIKFYLILSLNLIRLHNKNLFLHKQPLILDENFLKDEKHPTYANVLNKEPL